MTKDGHIVSLRLDDKDHENLVDFCTKNDVSKSDFIRQAISEKLEIENPEGNSVVIRLEIPKYYMEVMEAIRVRGAVKSLHEYIRFLIMRYAEDRMKELPVQSVNARDARCER